MVKNSFSKKGYVSMLKLAVKCGYSILPVRSYKKSKNATLILRHDVDLDLHAALQMATLEKNMKISSTFFILLFNNFYNPFSPENKKKIQKIKMLGHEIGIHWDSRDYKGNKNKFLRNKQLLEEIIEEKIISASQHEPVSSSNMELGSLIRHEMYRDFKTFTYISDSSMKWRKITPWDVIEKKENLHLLIHPFWWMTKGKNLKEKFDFFKKNRRMIDQRLIKEYYNDTKNFLNIRESLDRKYKDRKG